MNSSDLIAVRPHFRRNGSDLHFFLSERVFHTLTEGEALVWDRLQAGALPLEALSDATAVESLARAGVVEVIAPIPGANRRRILVVEPHCDDAALSVGATMWKMRREVEFHLLTLASRSNYTSAFQLHRDNFDRSKITAMRAAEGRLFAQHVGGQYHCAGMAEATLRYSDSDWDLDFFNDHEVAVANFNNRRSTPSVLHAWVERLRDFLSAAGFDEIWIPFGAGTHSDHDLARNAALQVLMEARPQAVFRLYEDVPYGGEFPGHSERILRQLRNAGAVLTPWDQDVTDAFSRKLSLLTIFASQFKVAAIRAGVERSAGPEAERIERLWTMDVLPREIDRDRIWFGAPDIEQAASELPRFRNGAEAARRVAVFAINAAGGWPSDLVRLRELFPRATFIVYAGPRAIAEFNAVETPLVRVRPVTGASAAWIRAALREIGTSHRILIAGQAVGKARGLARLWFSGRSIIVSQMDHLTQALTSD
jgi:LmbE family N-acetylglucosaminyl deacetylase